MKKPLALFLLVIFLPFLVSAETPKKKVLYFYSENCALCDEVDEYFNSNQFFEKYEVKKIDVAAPYNLEYLNRFFDVFEVTPEKRGWPAVVLGSEMLVGSQSIKDNFASEAPEKAGDNFSTPEGIKERLKNDQENLRGGFLAKKISLGVFLSAAVLDSFNPCALAVLVILLALMVFVRHKDRALLLGMFFILGVLAVYFLIGLSASWFLPWLLGASKVISLTAAIAIMLLGLNRLLKIFSLDRYLEIQRNWSQALGVPIREKERLAESKIFSPLGSFILGILSSFFLLPCAYRPYLVTTDIMLKSNIFEGGRFFLILGYNLIFIIPMTVLVAGIYFGSKNQRLNQWEEKNKKLVDALVSGVLIFVGIYLIQNWV